MLINKAVMAYDVTMAKKCETGCTCKKHALRNVGQFQAGSAGFTGKHSDDARIKIKAARARQVNVSGGGPAPIAAYERVMARSIPDGECLIWTGAVNGKGYGQIGTGSMRDGTRKVTRTHRVVYERHHGPVPEGLEIDHLCRNRRCVRVEHLEAVTHQVNISRSVKE